MKVSPRRCWRYFNSVCSCLRSFCFFFNDTATTEIYTLSLHDALPIWGSNAEVGKGGVRMRGPYVLMRHPLYAGNCLILLGLVVIFNNPWAYPLFLLPFAYLYHVITNMEEKRMHRRFGADYQEYEGRAVPRFLPALGNLGMALRTTLPFGWELAWRKEGESCCGWL